MSLSTPSRTSIAREDGIERLRAAFLQSMQLDREKRLQATAATTNDTSNDPLQQQSQKEYKIMQSKKI